MRHGTIAAITLYWAVAVSLGQAGIGTAFTYQGQLKENGVPVNGTVNMVANLWDAATGGNIAGTPVDLGPVQVTSGLFTVQLDYANSFNGYALWLEFTVNGTTLAPRQPLTPTPYALYAAAPWRLSNGNLDYLDGGYVGINTFGQPRAPLEVTGFNPYPQLKVSAHPLAPFGAFLSIDATHTTGGKDYLIFSTGANAGEGRGKLVFKDITDGTTAMAIDSSGNVGIGTLSLAAPLDVHGSPAANLGVVNATQDSGPTSSAAVSAVSNAANANAIVGRATSGDGAYAILGIAPAPGVGMAGVFSGDVFVNGQLSKSSGSFKIDHPLDPANKYLYHSFVESPDMKNFYDGVVTTDATGHATVELPEWFGALNRDFRYQLTVLDWSDSDEFVQAKVVQDVSDNKFVIRTSAPGVRVSWLVTGIRWDAWAQAHRVPVEVNKPAADRGRYLHPELYGLSEEYSALAEKLHMTAEPAAQPASVR